MATNGVASKSRTARRGTFSTTARIGWLVSGLLIAFLLVDGVMNLLKMVVSVEGTVDLGYPESTVIWIGLTLTICTIFYAIPRTALLGAILLTGYFGGAIATAVRLEDPWLVFPAAVGVLVWIGLAMRDSRTRAHLQQTLGMR